MGEGEGQNQSQGEGMVWALVVYLRLSLTEPLITVYQLTCSFSLVKLMKSCSRELLLNISNPKMSKIPIKAIQSLTLPSLERDMHFRVSGSPLSGRI